MKYAVVKIGGNQYRVTEGEELLVDNLRVKEGESVNFETILLFVDEDKIEIGSPLVENVVVKAKVLGSQKGEKIRVARFKAKSRYRKVRGFRHSYTRVKIESIGSSSPAKKTSKKTS